MLQAPDTPAHCQLAARDLIEAASNPLALSASDALLAATRLCAEQKCQATVKALQKEGKMTEDERDAAIKEIQSTTDEYIGKLDKAVEERENMIMGG